MMSWYWFPPLFIYSYFFSCSLTHTWSVIITPNHHSSLIQLGLDWVCCFNTTHILRKRAKITSHISVIPPRHHLWYTHNRYRKHLKSHHHFSLYQINWIKRSFQQLSHSLWMRNYHWSLGYKSQSQKSSSKETKVRFQHQLIPTFHTYQNLSLQYLPACNPCLNPNFVLPESPVSLNHYYYKV